MIPASIEQLKESIFFIMDYSDGSSMAVISILDRGYNLLIFKEHVHGWVISDGHIVKHLLADEKKFDITKEFEKAINHASIKKQLK